MHAIDPRTLHWQVYAPTPGPRAPSDQWLSSRADARPEDKRALVSLLAEEQIPQFVTHFLGPIAALLEPTADRA